MWRIPRDYKPGMRVPARLYASKDLVSKMRRDRTFTQLVGITFLQGILKWAVGLPDAHQGYGFPIGGVAATDL